MDRARHRHHGGVHRRPGQHRAERRDPHDPARVPHHVAEPAMGGHRVRAHVRDTADHRRPAGRHLRPPAHLRHRGRIVRCRVAARLSRNVGTRARARRSRHRRHRRVVDAPDDACDPLGDLPGPGAGGCLRGLGRDRGCRGRGRTGRRRVLDHQLLLALVVSDQRHHCAARNHRCVALHEARRAPGATHPRRLRRCTARRGWDVPLRLRPQRGRDLRVVEAAPARVDRRRHVVVRRLPDRDHTGCARGSSRDS